MTAPLLTLAEVAVLLHVSYRQVKRYVAQAWLRVVWLGPRSPRVRPTEIDAFLTGCDRRRYRR